jgi:hypothetical protein
VNFAVDAFVAMNLRAGAEAVPPGTDNYYRRVA